MGGGAAAGANLLGATGFGTGANGSAGAMGAGNPMN